MIPVLFSADTTEFTSNGLGSLADCISCKVTEKRNGEYILSMQYPLDGIHYDDIQKSSIIYVKPSDGANNQAFRIYKIKKPLNGIVTIEAEHISYQLSNIPTMPFTAQSVTSALQGLKTNAVESCPFYFYTDKQTLATYTQEQPASIRSRLGGVSGSILDVYGGEYEFDNYDVHLWNSRGSNNGVTIRYGKNLTDISQEENIQNVITGVVPFFANEETLVTLPEYVIESEYVSLYPYPRTVILDLSSEWTDTVPTESQLRERAQQYISDNNIGIPKVSISVSFIALWQTEEYKDIAPLERVKLCDTITVIFDKLGIQTTAKVITTEYDVLKERYTKIEVGDARSTLASTIVDIDSGTNTKIEASKSFMQKAIVHATQMITGGLGGYVYLKPNADGYPEEILIMDTPNIDTAVNVWRWNKNGLGFSSTGYSGTYGTAITSDGKIVADFITAGTLNGDLIEAGTVAASALDVEAQEQVGLIQNCLPYDCMTNINRWKLSQGDGGIATAYFQDVQVEGQSFHALVLDGSQLGNGNANLTLDTNMLGQLKFDYLHKVFIDQDLTLTSDVGFTFLMTPDGNAGFDGQRLTRWEAGTVDGNRLYTVETTFNAWHTAYPEYGSKNIVFNFLPGVRIYLCDFKITAEGENFKKAVLSVTSNGIDSVVQSGDIISMINQSAEEVSISANRINLTGDLSLRGDFKSYNPSDDTQYCHLQSGNLSFYANGVNLFTISSQAILGQYAGIFFGSVDDPSSMANYTYIEQNMVSTPRVYCKADGNLSSSLSDYDMTLIVENHTRFNYIRTGLLTVLGENPDGTAGENHIYGLTSVHDGIQFYSNVKNSSGGTEFVSDRRKKRNIVDLAIKKARSFIMALKPVKYKFIKEISTSNRYHHGFIAQDVKKVMPEDWGIYCEDKKQDFIGLRYDEFIADMVAVIQDHEKRIKELESELKKRSRT